MKEENKKKEASRDQVQVKSFLLQATSSSRTSVILDQGVKFLQDFFSVLKIATGPSSVKNSITTSATWIFSILWISFCN